MKHAISNKTLKARPLDKPDLIKFLGLLNKMLALEEVAGCERLDADCKVSVSPDGLGSMNVSYDMGVRYCCTCMETDADVCGECTKSSREPGVIRVGQQFRGRVESWTFDPQKAHLADPIVVVKKRKKKQLK